MVSAHACSHALSALTPTPDRKLYLNVIPYNPTAVEEDFKPPTEERTQKFIDTVRSHGVQVLIRQELGQDISSACGQLVIENSVKCVSRVRVLCWLVRRISHHLV